MRKHTVEIMTDDGLFVMIPLSKISSLELKGQKLTINTVSSDWYDVSGNKAGELFNKIGNMIK